MFYEQRRISLTLFVAHLPHNLRESTKSRSRNFFLIRTCSFIYKPYFLFAHIQVKSPSKFLLPSHLFFFFFFVQHVESWIRAKSPFIEDMVPYAAGLCVGWLILSFHYLSIYFLNYCEILLDSMFVNSAVLSICEIINIILSKQSSVLLHH